MSSLPSADDAKMNSGSSSSRGWCSWRCAVAATAAVAIAAASVAAFFLTRGTSHPPLGSSSASASSSSALAKPRGSLPASESASLPSIQLSSSAFVDGGPIPQKYTKDGEDIFPPLSWSGVPPGTESFFLTMHDPDAGLVSFTHWVLFNIPPSVTNIEEGVNPKNAGGSVEQGVNSWNEVGYGGPKPPKGDGDHRYLFELFAVSGVIEGLKAKDATRKNVLAQIKKEGFDIIGQGQLMGTYRRD